MNSTKFNSIQNVFICDKDNSLKLVNINFDKTILQIIPVLGRSIKWNDISTELKRKRFINNLNSSLKDNNSKLLNGNFLLLIPGGIDPHVHFDTPGFEFRDDFEHASRAAAFGGTTTIIDMPDTSLPTVTSAKNLRTKLSIVRNRSVVDFCFWGGVRGNDFEDQKEIKKHITNLTKEGVAGFKAYVISGMDTFTDLSYVQMLDAAKYVKENEKVLAVHAEDKNRIENRKTRFQKNNLNDWNDYCKARDEVAEEKAIESLIKIASITSCQIHVVHLSSAKGLEQIRKAKAFGLNITAETCPHYLYFTQQDFKNKRISAFLKTAPPVKKIIDRSALWKGLSDGSLLFVTTDHAGCNPKKEKSSKNFWNVYGGIPGVEHRVPFLFSEGFFKGKLSLQKTIELLSTNAADFFDLKQKGKIEVGRDADFALVNLWTSEVIKSRNMQSKGKYTPFEDVVFNARIEKTILRSMTIMDRKYNFIAKPGIGKFIRIKNEN